MKTYSDLTKIYGINNPGDLMEKLGVKYDAYEQRYEVKDWYFKSLDEALSFGHRLKILPGCSPEEGGHKIEQYVSHPKKNHDPDYSPYPIFSRKQLAWMGLITGALLLILLNVEFSRSRSLIEQFVYQFFSYSSRKTAFWITNATAVGLVWSLRVHLGALFAFVVGVFLNLVSLFAKKV